MIVKDWATEAAKEIEENPGEPRPNLEFTPGYIKSVITKHCPFEADTAYMKVPRCETCKHWFNDGSLTNGYGACRTPSVKVTVSAESWYRLETTKDFGCVQHEEKP